jgi:uroporphyrinogen-III synthase
LPEPGLAESGAAVLVTRPEPGATETARRIAALGWRPVLVPALVLTPCGTAEEALPAAQALLLASRAAARAVPPSSALPVLAVGEATAAEARAHGFVNVAAAEGDAAALVALATARLDPEAGPLLLAVGAGYGAELAAALRQRGFRVLHRVAYSAEPATVLPEAARAALAAEAVVAALFFSPRSAGCAISLLRAAGLAGAVARAEALAISPRVAAVLAAAAPEPRWRGLRVAARPNQDSLLRLLGPGPGTKN